VEDALDAVVDGACQAAVVDGAAMDCYQHRKPGRFGNLKEIGSPETFPVPIVAYVDGKLDDATLCTVREGICRAQQTAKGQRVLMLWKLTGFETVPDDYPALLDDIAESYSPASSVRE
jgi:hypothetical protein